MWLFLPYSHLPARTPDEQAAARNVFLRLTGLGQGTRDTRRRARIRERSHDQPERCRLSRQVAQRLHCGDYIRAVVDGTDLRAAGTGERGAPPLERCLEPHRHRDRDIGCARMQGML